MFFMWRGMRTTATCPVMGSGRRWLSLHEYQSASLLERYGIGVPRGIVAATPQDAVRALETLSTGPVVVKAQVLAGGRGKGVFSNGFVGGIHVIDERCNDDRKRQVNHVSSMMLGYDLKTKQTGHSGRPCALIYICEKKKVKKEFYFAILADRKTRSLMLVGSCQGGMDIEAVAESSPTAIVSQTVSTDFLSLDDAMAFAKKIKIPPKIAEKAGLAFQRLVKLYLEKDATLVEINPLAVTEDMDVVCLDAKITFDDNADFRQRDIFSLRDKTQEDEREIRASEYKLNYIPLDGSIGCLVNGAGLAMATMDIIKLEGGEPANFLDVGGSATVDQVSEAFRILTSDDKVSSILVNIFGGIMRCDVIAQGIIQAASKLDLKVPLVVRLQGTRVQEAKDMISSSGLKIFSIDDLTEAARMSVNLSMNRDGGAS